MGFETGQRVIHKASSRAAFVRSTAHKRLIEVKWEDTGGVENRPSEEFRMWDRLTIPPSAVPAGRESGAPAYLVDLRNSLPETLRKNAANVKMAAEQKLKDELLSLSGNRKNRTAMKAKKKIAKFEKGIYPPLNMSRKFTADDVESAKTPRGGFSRESLRQLGVPWPPPKGWRKRITAGEPKAKLVNRRDVVSAKKREKSFTKPCKIGSMKSAAQVFHQSDGEVTKAYYAEMNARGLEGQLAVALFRAQKRSTAAKKYRRGVWRRDAYDVKNWSLSEVCRILTAMDDRLAAPRWGWKRDPNTPGFEWVLYVDLPTGQCSFHSADRLNGPNYPGEWDSGHGSERHICEYCDRIAETRVAVSSVVNAPSPQRPVTQ